VTSQMNTYRLSRRSMLAGLAGFTSISALLTACSSETGVPASASPTTATTSPSASPTPAHLPIGTTLNEYRGHTLGVFAVAWSPGGKYIASGGFDKTVRVWNALTGETLQVYHGHTDQVNSVGWSPDGKYIASSGDGRVRIWDAMTGHTIFTQGGVSAQVYGTAWSPDSKYIAAYGVDDAKKVPTLQIWNVASHTIVFTTDLPNSQRSAVAWSPDTRRLAYASSTGAPQSWAMPSGQLPIVYPGKAQWLCLDWSHDGKHLAAGSYDGIVQIWDARTTNITYTRHVTVAVQALAWSPNSMLIASTESSVVRVWQAA
jgi:WD40 repeat protein